MKQKSLEVVGAVVHGESDGGPAILAFRRRAEKSAGGKWEFPGGKVEHNETQTAALTREIYEELGIDIRVDELVHRASTVVDGRAIDLACYWVTAYQVPTESTDHDAITWVPLADLRALDWAEPDLPVLEVIEETLAEDSRGTFSDT